MSQEHSGSWATRISIQTSMGYLETDESLDLGIATFFLMTFECFLTTFYKSTGSSISWNFTYNLIRRHKCWEILILLANRVINTITIHMAS